ncbi:hypothetical protein N7517_007254 [Penicillium concentricum]|uniref:Uncharacterized protein n=1 Tax=Penicillium concentricum TaxID=293559 RepID=A0A9W9VAR2_9EURO|nr:uncharacterized protein N7517_007254 [Penicillium concentricum]KAJ5375248.1 hypothetical protein N7517_007254 [Penicillium concentricum]
MDSVGDPSAPPNPPPGPGSSANGFTSRQRKRLKEKRRRLRKASPKEATKAAKERIARLAELYSRTVQAQAELVAAIYADPGVASGGMVGMGRDGGQDGALHGATTGAPSLATPGPASTVGASRTPDTHSDPPRTARAGPRATKPSPCLQHPSLGSHARTRPMSAPLW